MFGLSSMTWLCISGYLMGTAIAVLSPAVFTLWILVSISVGIWFAFQVSVLVGVLVSVSVSVLVLVLLTLAVWDDIPRKPRRIKNR